MRRAKPYSSLRPKQIDCVLNSAKKQDLLCILATGYGKTLVFKLIPIYLSACESNSSCNQVKGYLTIVISSPLNAIITQQKQLLGTSAILINSEKMNIDREPKRDDSSSYAQRI